MLKNFFIFIMVISAYSTDHFIFNKSCDVDLSTLQDPFFQQKSHVDFNFSLQAIMSNKVKINDVWYMLNDEINGFKIIKIDRFQVLLIKNNKEEMVLNLYEKNNNIIIY
ncbi:hypothetical protein IY974_07380 [Campylobacter volucris]|nr:hypothetical protein [Campylobacter volucris]